MEVPPTPVDDLAGVTLVERYHIKGKLGQGGMGSIYQAHDAILDRDVALKTIPRYNLNDHELVRFHREGKAASTVSHPNVIQMLDFGVLESGQPFMVIELIQGVSLFDLIKQKGPQPVEFVLRIVEQIAAGMTAVHKAGIVHRDLKTSNIMLLRAGLATNQPLIKILDFGIAKSLNSREQVNTLTKAGQIFGSPNYMSPEQARAGSVDHRTDVYSLGCIMFEMLTAHVLFEGDTVVEVVTRHISEPAPRMWEVCDRTFPMEVERLVAHMVAKDAADRFQTMDEVISNIKDVYATVCDVQIETPAIEPDERARQISDRRLADTDRKLVGSIAVAAILLFGSISVVGYYLWNAAITNKAREQPKEKVRAVERAAFSVDMMDTFEKKAELDGFYVDNSGAVTKKLEHLVKQGDELSLLTLPDAKIVPGDVSLMAKLHPKKMILRGATGITDSVLKDISQIKSLESINLDLCAEFTPKGLTYLAGLPDLNTLSLQDCALNDEHLKALKTVAPLVQVRLAKNRKITIEGLTNLGNRVIPVKILIDHALYLTLSKEQRAQFKKKHNIVLYYPGNTPLPEDAAKYMTQLGLQELDPSAQTDDGSKSEVQYSELDKKLLRHLQ